MGFTKFYSSFVREDMIVVLFLVLLGISIVSSITKSLTGASFFLACRIN
jgi:hypothetical protein